METRTIKSEQNLICRICLTESEDTKKLNLIMFEYCTGIDTSETPQSTQICLKCECSLNDFSLFKEKCLESHESLIKMYSENINEPVFEEWLGDDNEIAESTEDPIEETQIIEKEEDDESIDEDDKMDQEETSSSSSNEETKTAKTNKNKKNILCMHCGKYYSQNSIYSHIQSVHQELTERFKCDHCEKTYKRKEALTRHQRFHLNAKPYACSLCDESFLYWSARKDHMVYAHSAPYRFNCDICDYKTQQSHAFSRHKRQHTGDLPFKCEECQKQFIDRRQLRTHMITHTKDKNFICEVCSKAFGSKKYLNSHMRIHNQERNYWCPVESCGKTFIQNHVLKSHMKANHPEVDIPPPGTIVSKKIYPKNRKCNLIKI